MQHNGKPEARPGRLPLTMELAPLYWGHSPVTSSPFAGDILKQPTLKALDPSMVMDAVFRL